MLLEEYKTSDISKLKTSYDKEKEDLKSALDDLTKVLKDISMIIYNVEKKFFCKKIFLKPLLRDMVISSKLLRDSSRKMMS